MTTDHPADDDLQAIRAARIEIRRLHENMAGDVRSAKHTGATWEQIGDALAISKQAAQQRYGRTNQCTAADTAAGVTPSIFSN